MADEQAQTQPNAAETAATAEPQVSLLDQIIHETRLDRDEQQAEQSRQQIATLVQAVLSQTVKVSKDLEHTLTAKIADIDELISRQLNEILHHPDFRAQFFAALRGDEEVYYLMLESHFGKHFAPFGEASKAIGD